MQYDVATKTKVFPTENLKSGCLLDLKLRGELYKEFRNLIIPIEMKLTVVICLNNMRKYFFTNDQREERRAVWFFGEKVTSFRLR